jgi:ribose/xylose/arabinose/galactoside ABC-type transport system permease subunit
MFAEIGNKICGVTSTFAGCADQAAVIGVGALGLALVLLVGGIALYSAGRDSK